MKSLCVFYHIDEGGPDPSVSSGLTLTVAGSIGVFPPHYDLAAALAIVHVINIHAFTFIVIELTLAALADICKFIPGHTQQGQASMRFSSSFTLFLSTVNSVGILADLPVAKTMSQTSWRLNIISQPSVS